MKHEKISLYSACIFKFRSVLAIYISGVAKFPFGFMGLALLFVDNSGIDLGDTWKQMPKE